MVRGEMAPIDVDVPRAVSLDYFSELCPNEERYIINDKDIKKDLSWDTSAKVIFNALLQRVYAPDVRRYREERRRYSITCMSSVPPAANDLNDRPRRLFSSDYALDLWAEFCKSLIFSKFPVIHAAYNKQFFELESTSFLSALYAFDIQTLCQGIQTDRYPFPKTPDGLLILHFQCGDFDQHCWNFIEHSSGYTEYNSFDELPDCPPSLLASQRKKVPICI